MHEVLRVLNPKNGPDFVSVYIDDVLSFSWNLEDHIKHIQQVVQRIADCGLKLKPDKCHLARHEVEFLGHVVTAEGLKPNAAQVEAVATYPAPSKKSASSWDLHPVIAGLYHVCQDSGSLASAASERHHI